MGAAETEGARAEEGLKETGLTGSSRGARQREAPRAAERRGDAGERAERGEKEGWEGEA
jgi:hypothetical protein